MAGCGGKQADLYDTILAQGVGVGAVSSLVRRVRPQGIFWGSRGFESRMSQSASQGRRQRREKPEKKTDGGGRVYYYDDVIVVLSWR